MVLTPKTAKSKKYKDSAKACAAIEAIYQTQIEFLRTQFENFSNGKIPKEKVSGFYPYLRIEVTEQSFKKLKSDTRHSYGFVSKPGVYETTLTRPDIFGRYYCDQIAHLIRNHNIDVEVGVSDTPIPVHFALDEGFHLEADLSVEQIEALPNLFDQPDLEFMDDRIANATYKVREGEPNPLAIFTAPRTDLSLLRLKHYTGTRAGHFPKLCYLHQLSILY